MIKEFQGQYRFLSNFWYANVVLDGHTYPSVEHAYVAAKTLSHTERFRFMDPAIKPGQVKQMGRKLKLRDDWEQVKLGIMEDLVRQKFNVSPLKEMLLMTNQQILIEGNRWGDTFWGVCNGKGQNHLGEILMKVRSELQ